MPNLIEENTARNPVEIVVCSFLESMPSECLANVSQFLWRRLMMRIGAARMAWVSGAQEEPGKDQLEKLERKQESKSERTVRTVSDGAGKTSVEKLEI